MSRGIIYLILNKQTGEKYVGNTTLAMNKEWVHHIDRSKRMSSEPLHKAFRQYGVHNFMIKELDEYDDTCLENKLNEWTDKYKPEYNPAEGISASAIVINAEKTEEIIQEKREPVGLSDSEIPKPVKKEKRNYNANNLKPFNEHTRGNGKHLGLKIRGKNLQTGVCKDYDSARDAATDVTGDPNANGNILNAARKYRTAYGHKWQILEEKNKKKAVFGVNKKTELIEVRYESIAAAVRDLGGSEYNTDIVRSLRNPGKYSWKNYYWFYG
jgi:group I intron endonuclease